MDNKTISEGMVISNLLAEVEHLKDELVRVRTDYDAQYKAQLDAEARWANQCNDLQRQLDAKDEEINKREAFHASTANRAERNRGQLRGQVVDLERQLAKCRTKVKEYETDDDRWEHTARFCTEQSQKAQKARNDAQAQVARLRGVLGSYCVAMGKIYNHNEAARAAVVQHFGTVHPQDTLASASSSCQHEWYDPDGDMTCKKCGMVQWEMEHKAAQVVEALKAITCGVYNGPTEEELLLRITQGEMQAAQHALRNYEAGR